MSSHPRTTSVQEHPHPCTISIATHRLRHRPGGRVVDKLIEHQLSPLLIEQHEGAGSDARPILARLVNRGVFAGMDMVFYGIHLLIMQSAARALHRLGTLGVAYAWRRVVSLVRGAKQWERLRVVARLEQRMRTLQQEAHTVRGSAAFKPAHSSMQCHQLRSHTREGLL